jgi:hypothetical protein
MSYYDLTLKYFGTSLNEVDNHALIALTLINALHFLNKLCFG